MKWSDFKRVLLDTLRANFPYPGQDRTACPILWARRAEESYWNGASALLMLDIVSTRRDGRIISERDEDDIVTIGYPRRVVVRMTLAALRHDDDDDEFDALSLLDHLLLNLHNVAGREPGEWSADDGLPAGKTWPVDSEGHHLFAFLEDSEIREEPGIGQDDRALDVYSVDCSFAFTVTYTPEVPSGYIESLDITPEISGYAAEHPINAQFWVPESAEPTP